MKIRFEANNTDSLEMTATITMPMREWRQLREQISASPNAYPTWKLLSSIDAVVRKASAHFESEDLGQ